MTDENEPGDEEEHEEDGTESDDGSHRLYDGEALQLEDTASIMAESRATMVVVAGPVASGKTTLLTSLYESLQDAPFGGAAFAGSRTLVAFERRCHDGRVASGRTSPETPRTPVVEGSQFLHLRLRRSTSDGSATRDLLLSDISGEVFQRLRDMTPSEDEFGFLKRADRLCVVMDGAKLASASQRQLPRNDARSLLRSVLEASAIREDCAIDIVFAKWDEIERTRDESTLRFLKDTTKLLKELCVSRTVAFFEVAARPKAPSPPFAHGLGTLLRAWLEHSAERRPTLTLELDDSEARAHALLSRSVDSSLVLWRSHAIEWR